MFQKISGIEKFYASEGYVTIFLRKFFVSQYRNISQKHTFVLCFRNFLLSKNVKDKREREGGVSRFSGPVGYDIETFSSASLLTHC